MTRLLTVPFRLLWAPIAAFLRLLGFGTGVGRHSWQPPAGTSHPLWDAVQARREAEARTVARLAPRRDFRRLAVGALAAAVVVALVGAVGSLAFLTSSGSGSGSAVAGTTPGALVLSPGSVPSSSFLYPGASGGVVLTVANPNGFAVKIPSLVQDPVAGTGGFGAVGCALAQAHLAFTATASTLDGGGSGWTVPAHATAYEIDLPAAVSMGVDAENACQGAMFAVYLKVGT